MLTPFQKRARNALRENSLFGAFSDEALRWTSRTSLPKGQVLFEKGHPSTALYGLVGGQVKLFSTDTGGREICFGILGPGELVGEVGISTSAPRHMSAVALSNAELVTINQRDLEPLLVRQPALQDALAEASVEATRQLSERIEDAAFLSIEQRVEKALFDFAHRFGERLERGKLSVPLRQRDLADALGLSRESVSKVLTSPAMRGRIKLGRGKIVILRA
jgi:CRP/FNR family cyclic AMP-dependent transcriptional regulator